MRCIIVHMYTYIHTYLMVKITLFEPKVIALCNQGCYASFEHAKIIVYTTAKHTLTTLELSRDVQLIRFSKFKIFLVPFPTSALRN